MPACYVLVTDERETIVHVNEEWIGFALSNWAEDFSPDLVLGQRLWRFVSDDATKSVYHTLLKKVREGGRRLGFPFRCDSPRLRRYMSMNVSPLEDGRVQWRSELLGEEPRLLVIPTAPEGPSHADRLLTVCSWCLQACVPDWLPIREGSPLPGSWLELEDLMVGLADLFHGYYPPITHGICPACFQRVSALLKLA